MHNYKSIHRIIYFQVTILCSGLLSPGELQPLMLPPSGYTGNLIGFVRSACVAATSCVFVLNNCHINWADPTRLQRPAGKWWGLQAERAVKKLLREHFTSTMHQRAETWRLWSVCSGFELTAEAVKKFNSRFDVLPVNTLQIVFFCCEWCREFKTHELALFN